MVEEERRQQELEAAQQLAAEQSLRAEAEHEQFEAQVRSAKRMGALSAVFEPAACRGKKNGTPIALIKVSQISVYL